MPQGASSLRLTRIAIPPAGPLCNFRTGPFPGLSGAPRPILVGPRPRGGDGEYDLGGPFRRVREESDAGAGVPGDEGEDGERTTVRRNRTWRRWRLRR
jgi:hypothetical protein